MSIKTPEKDADWVMTVKLNYKENAEYFLTDNDYDKYRTADSQNMRTLHFEDGSITMSAIVKVVPVIRAQVVEEDHQVESPDPFRQKSHDELKHQAILSDNLRARLEQKGIIKPKRMRTQLPASEYEKKREELLAQGEQLQNAK